MTKKEQEFNEDMFGDSRTGDLSLPNTGLRVTNRDLILERENGVIIKSWPIRELTNIRAVRRLNPFGLVLIGSACAMIYITLSIGMAPWLRGGLYVLATLCALVGLLTIVIARLCFSHLGRPISLECDDEFTMVDAVAKVISENARAEPN